jgi:predicted RND superfamily exporter protein
MKDKKLKKVKKQSQQQVVQKQKDVEQNISKTGWKIIIFSVITLAIGFLLIIFTNPEGTNWASIVAPLIIVISYIFIIIGILTK